MVLGLEPSADNLLSVECLLKVSLDSLDSLRVGLRSSSSSLFLLDRVGSLTQFPSVCFFHNRHIEQPRESQRRFTIYFFLVICPLGIREGNRKCRSLSYANLALWGLVQRTSTLRGGGGVSGLWMKTDKGGGGVWVKWMSTFEQLLSWRYPAKFLKHDCLLAISRLYLATNPAKQSHKILCFSMVL